MDKMPSEISNPDNAGLKSFDLFCWRLLIWIMGMATPLLVSLQPRRFVVGEVDAAESAAGITHLIGQFFALFFLFFACLALMRHLGRKRNGNNNGEARFFWFCTILLIAMPTVSTIVAGDPITSSGIAGTVILYTATYFLPSPPLDWWIREVRLMLLAVFVYGSLLAGLFFPSWAWNLDYATESSTAILPFRLFGTAEHANALAPLAIFIWSLGRFPNCRLRGEALHGAATLLVLFLCQSKTNLAIVALLLAVYYLRKIRRLSWGKRLATYLFLGVTSLLGIVYLVKFSPFASWFEDLLYDPQVITLTGRLPVWLFAIEMWLERPWFGQGLDAWSSNAVLDYISLLGWGVTHAHNQLLQILSQSGLVGAGVFAVWANCFRKIARDVPAEIRAPFWWLLMLFFLPGLMEVILQYGLGKASAIRTWLLFVMSLLLIRKPYYAREAVNGGEAQD